jgi:hypothetical protein
VIAGRTIWVRILLTGFLIGNTGICKDNGPRIVMPAAPGIAIDPSLKTLVAEDGQ